VHILKAKILPLSLNMFNLRS